jgi:D-arabinose 1-dehydrogenase-like Zn-dependent alcohol dehydrogenase
VPTDHLFTANITLKGITVGSRQEQEDVIRVIEANNIQPMISYEYSLDQLQQAFELQAAQKHFGKIVISL